MSKKPAYVPRIGGRYERDSADAKPVRTGGTDPADAQAPADKPARKPDAGKKGDGK